MTLKGIELTMASVDKYRIRSGHKVLLWLLVAVMLFLLSPVMSLSLVILTLVTASLISLSRPLSKLQLETRWTLYAVLYIVLFANLIGSRPYRTGFFHGWPFFFAERHLGWRMLTLTDLYSWRPEVVLINAAFGAALLMAVAQQAERSSQRSIKFTLRWVFIATACVAFGFGFVVFASQYRNFDVRTTARVATGCSVAFVAFSFLDLVACGLGRLTTK